jgi:membrane-bound lytic murein transglycosylase MltF
MKLVAPKQSVRRQIMWPSALLVALGLCTAAQARSLVEIVKTRELRACLVPIHPAVLSAAPADCREACEFTGPVYEEVQAFAKSLGKNIRLKTRRIDWDEQFFDVTGRTVREAGYTPQLLASGVCDLYPSNLTRNSWRLKKMDFVTLFPSRMMVVAHAATRARLKSAADLAGLRAAVEKNTSLHTWLEEQNLGAYAARPIKIELMATTDDAIAGVDAGNADFTLLDSDAAIWTTRHQLKNAYVAFPVGPKDEIGWAFRKEDKDLQAAVATFFAQQKSRENSEFNQIWVKHLGLGLNKFIAVINSTP